MVNKTLKAVVAAFTLVAGSSVFAVAGGDNTVITQCIQGGQNVTVEGQNCSAVAGSGQKGSRARGDVVTFNNISNKTAKQLSQSGKITVPAEGTAEKYAFGQMEFVIASFDLQAPSANLPSALARIVNAARNNNPEANALILIAVAKKGASTYTEAFETVTDLEDLSQSEKIQYKATGANSIEVMMPASKNARAWNLTLNLNPIK